MKSLIYFLFFVGFVPLALYSVSQPLKGIELDKHIVQGKWILDHQEIPDKDVFSHSCTDKTLSNYHFAADILLGALYKLSNSYLLIRLFLIGIFTLILALLWNTGRRLGWPIYTMMGLVALFFLAVKDYCMAESFLLGQFCFVLLLYWWPKVCEGHTKTLIAFVLTALIWSNSDTGYMIGLMTFSLLAFIKQKEEARHALKALLFMFLCWPLNLGGVSAVTTSFKKILERGSGSSVSSFYIPEFAAPELDVFSLKNVYAFLLIVLLLCSLLRYCKNKKRVALLDILPALILVVCFVKYQYYLMPLSIYTMFFTLWQGPLPSLKNKTHRPTQVLVLLILLGTIGSQAYAFSIQTKVPYSSHRHAAHDVSAVAKKIQLLKAQGYLKGQMYNDIDQGSALALALGETSVFVDSRYQLYGSSFLRDSYLALAHSSTDSFRKELLDSYKLSYAVVSLLQYRGSGKFTQFFLDQKWKLFYVDAHCMAFAAPEELPKGYNYMVEENFQKSFYNLFEFFPLEAETVISELMRVRSNQYTKLVEPLIDYMMWKYPDRPHSFFAKTVITGFRFREYETLIKHFPDYLVGRMMYIRVLMRYDQAKGLLELAKVVEELHPFGKKSRFASIQNQLLSLLKDLAKSSNRDENLLKQIHQILKEGLNASEFKQLDFLLHN